MGTSNISPKKFFQRRFYERVDNIKLSKKKKKISSDDFQVLSFREYKRILEINYNVSQLKVMARAYKQKVSGNKKELINRVYNYLKLSNFAVIMQKSYRGHMRRRYDAISGRHIPLSLCTNETDFLSLNKIAHLSLEQRFCFKDADDFTYAFDIRSLHNLVKLEKHPKNPYNRKPLSMKTINNMKAFIRISKIYGHSLKLSLKDPLQDLTQQKKIELKAVSLFQKIDTLGHITNSAWLLNLSPERLCRFIKELADIWNYRTQLSDHTKMHICPPHGKPFMGINLQMLRQQSRETLRNTSLYVIENMVDKGQDANAKSLGAFYVLAALTLVNQDAAAALPWLYESVVQN